MRSIINRLALWQIILIIGVAAIAIPVAARVSSGAAAAVNGEHIFQDLRSGIVNDDAGSKIISKYGGNRQHKTVSSGVKLPQDYYDRRREYWEKRVNRRLEDSEEYMDSQTGDDDEEDAKDKKDSKSAKDDKDDEDDDVDKDVEASEERYERRREYWRERVEREW